MPIDRATFAGLPPVHWTAVSAAASPPRSELRLFVHCELKSGNQNPCLTDTSPAFVAARATGRASRWLEISPDRNNRRASPSAGLMNSSGGFGRGAVIHRLVAVYFNHRPRRDFLDVLRHQADVIGRRALLAIAIDRSAIEQRADRFDLLLETHVRFL